MAHCCMPQHHGLTITAQSSHNATHHCAVQQQMSRPARFVTMLAIDEAHTSQPCSPATHSHYVGRRGMVAGLAVLLSQSGGMPQQAWAAEVPLGRLEVRAEVLQCTSLHYMSLSFIAPHSSRPLLTHMSQNLLVLFAGGCIHCIRTTGL